MAHIEIICTANICRSPLVEALVRRGLAAQADYADWVVTSSGTWAQRVRGAARGSIKLGAEAGLDLSQHQARMVTREIAEAADLLICMTASHKEALQVDFRDQAHKIFLLSEMVGRKYDVSDPYGGPIEGYVTMSKEVTKLVADGLPRMIELAEKNVVQAVNRNP